MGQPDVSDLSVRVAIPFTCDDQRQYMNESYLGLKLTDWGYLYTQRYVLPFLPGAAPEIPRIPPPYYSGWDPSVAIPGGDQEGAGQG